MVDKASDRRRWPRFSAADSRVRLGWWKGGAYQTTTARLVNISRGGAVVEADALPPKEGSVWICSTSRGDAGWVEAELRPAMIRPRGPHRLRLIFRDHSSAEPFFSASAFGRGPAAPDPGSDASTPGPSTAGEPWAEALATLGLHWPCSTDQVRGAYHRLALRVHPDRGGAPEDFIRLQFAYRAMMERCASSPADRGVARSGAVGPEGTGTPRASGAGGGLKAQ
ncbi:DnaJ domain-containing protein [Tautonia plasticadhaerens]|uniref:DnaJ domain protein n=1 Tax=Tautonia plasticadhaerens TaxID=2527974 RepID=A0A518HDN2_9BACT|nr:J domain-containing protein [Tautonia plasticadhaerens]QDV38943.1 DnaJ domain protein [Tautonia plasticadhaerens]